MSKSPKCKRKPLGRKEEGQESLPLIQTAYCRPKGGRRAKSLRADASKMFKTKYQDVKSWRRSVLGIFPQRLQE